LAAACLLVLLQAVPANWRSPLEIDEQVTYYIACGQQPNTVYRRATEQSATPPGYFWLVRASVDLGRALDWGTPEFWLRLPSLACYLAALGVAHRFGERLIAPGVGSAAAMILCCHPLGIDKMALQSRPYALGMLLVVVSLYSLRRLQTAGWSRWTFAGFLMANAALPWTHYLFAAFWPVEWLLVVATPGRSKRTALAAGLVVAGLSALPLVPAMQRIQAIGPALAWITEPPSLRMLAAFVDPAALGWSCAAALALGLLIRANASSPNVGLGLWLLVAAAGPALLMYAAAAGFGQPSLGQTRYVSPALAPILLTLGWLFAAISRRRAVVLAAVAFVAIANFPVGVWIRLLYPVWHDDHWKHAAIVLRDRAEDRDLLFVQSGLVEARLTPNFFADPGFQEYATSRISDFYLQRRLPRLTLPPFWPPVGETPDWQADYRTKLAAAKAAGGMVWLICSADTDVGAAAETAARTWFESQGWKLTLTFDRTVARVWRGVAK
jgi:hypothetical protein